MKTATDPEVRASQLYDFIMDEMRTFGPTETEAELALTMALAAYMSGTCNSDTEVVMATKRIGHNLEHYYEKAKQAYKKQQDEERIQIDTKDYS